MTPALAALVGEAREAAANAANIPGRNVTIPPTQLIILLDALEAGEREASERLAQVLYTRDERDAANRAREECRALTDTAFASLKERDAALAMSARYRDHEFTRPLDSQGCCAVCHQPRDFEAHRPASLTTERDAALALAGRLKEALEDVMALYDWDDPTATFEALAEVFYRETGIMAPGKAVPMEMAVAAPHEYERRDKYDAWIRARSKVVRERARALLADPDVERLVALQLLPEDMPPAEYALGAATELVFPRGGEGAGG